MCPGRERGAGGLPSFSREETSMAKGKVHERRRAPRLQVQSQAEGEGGRRIEASLVNLSAVGALIEHAGPPPSHRPLLVDVLLGRGDPSPQGPHRLVHRHGG